MDFQAFAALFLGVAVLAAKPGPGVMTVASKAVSEGIRPVLYFMAGTNLVKILFFSFAVFGFTVAEDKLLFFSILVKSLAAVYLIWMGVQGVRRFEPVIPGRAENPDEKNSGFFENFNAGFIMTMSNPLDILFFAGILPTILDLSVIRYDDIGMAAVAIVSGDASVALAYAIPLAVTRHYFSEDILKKVNVVASFAIICVGLFIGYSALPAMDLLSVFQ